MDSEPTSGYLYFDISTHYHTEFRKIHIASARGTLHVNEHEQVCLRTESNFRSLTITSFLYQTVDGKIFSFN
jgi:hypothetical protein